uniref:hypothetical protein n=1 Tax=uncultured Draconibacterium sp. TaxID=1573823 RepID=UPI003217C136
MKQLISWLIRNRKQVATVAGLVVEYAPKAYRYGKEKVKILKEKVKQRRAAKSKDNESRN